jgi:glycosidase
MGTVKDNIYGHHFELERRIRSLQWESLGIQHRNQRQPMAPQPGESIKISAFSTGALPIEEVCCWYTTSLGDDAFENAPSIPLTRSEVAWNHLEWEYRTTWEGEIPGQPGNTVLRYRIAGRKSGSDEWVFADTAPEGYEDIINFAVYIGEQNVPEWVRDAVIYQVFINRFYPGDGQVWNQVDSVNDYYGGTLQGVFDKLDFIEQMGYNTLWLSPIFASPTHHGYDATDMFKIEPKYGTNEDFKRLLDACHARGIRILLDFVANHWSNQHPYFEDAESNEDSPYRDWFLWREWPNEYEGFFNLKEMPKVNLRHGSPARQHMLDAAKFWLDMGVDGYRLDHANGPAHSFWADFRAVCMQANPESWVFGEIVKPPPVQLAYHGNLHGNLDFALADALRKTFGFQSWTLENFAAFLDSHQHFYPETYSAPSFLDNHDMNRFLTIAQEDKTSLKLAALILAALSAPPIIYYGTEVGISQNLSIDDGEGFDEARLPMLWGTDRDDLLMKYFRDLFALRKQFDIPHGELLRILHLDSEQETMAFVIGKPAAPVVIAINRSEAAREIFIPLNDLPAPKDYLGTAAIVVQGDNIKVVLEPRSGAWLA